MARWHTTHKGVRFAGTFEQMIAWLKAMGFGVAKATGFVGAFLLADAIGQILEVLA